MSARGTMARVIGRCGEPVIIRKAADTTAANDKVVRARVRQHGAHDLAGAIVQGDYEVIIAASTLAATGFSGAPQKGDKVIVGGAFVNGVWTPGTGRLLTVQHPGYRGAGTGYWMQCRGQMP